MFCKETGTLTFIKSKNKNIYNVTKGFYFYFKLNFLFNKEP